MINQKDSKNIPSALDGVRLWYLIGSVAWQVAVPVAAMLTLGVTLDRQFGTKPIYTVLLLGVAPVISALLVRRTVKIVAASADYTKKIKD